MRPTGRTATCSTSSAIARARRRFARRSPRRRLSSRSRLRRDALRRLRRSQATPTTRRRRRAACGGAAAPSTARHAERYLLARGLARCRFAALRFHPELRYREGSSVRRLPALVAAVTGDDGAVTGVQRTWLDPRSPAKAGVAAPRKALGRIYGRAVRFGRPADGAALLVGEGIETVLSVVTAVPEVTAAAALSAGSLGAFAPPPGTARLVIARDNDAEGERAAERLARRCARAGVAATVAIPQSDDFNDDLVALGAPTLAARFAPLFRPPGRGRGSEAPVGQAPLPSEGAVHPCQSIGATAMCHVTFQRVADDEGQDSRRWRIRRETCIASATSCMRADSVLFTVHLRG